jgi:hypothetical protein
MTCSSCGKRFMAGAVPTKCPHCGKSRSERESGVFQTSAVLISAGGTDTVYRSMDEVPRPWRTKLLQSTSGANSATILIADRRGREELARVMRSLGASGTARQRRAMRVQSLLAGTQQQSSREREPAWALRGRKAVLLAGLGLLAIGLIVVVFTHP